MPRGSSAACMALQASPPSVSAGTHAGKGGSEVTGDQFCRRNYAYAEKPPVQVYPEEEQHSMRAKTLEIIVISPT